MIDEGNFAGYFHVRWLDVLYGVIAEKMKASYEHEDEWMRKGYMSARLCKAV